MNWAMCYRCSLGKTLTVYTPITGPSNLPVVVAQSNEDCMTSQALCWCGKQTIRVCVVDKSEAYVWYIRRRKSPTSPGRRCYQQFAKTTYISRSAIVLHSKNLQLAKTTEYCSKYSKSSVYDGFYLRCFTVTKAL